MVGIVFISLPFLTGEMNIIAYNLRQDYRICRIYRISYFIILLILIIL